MRSDNTAKLSQWSNCLEPAGAAADGRLTEAGRATVDRLWQMQQAIEPLAPEVRQVREAISGLGAETPTTEAQVRAILLAISGQPPGSDSSQNESSTRGQNNISLAEPQALIQALEAWLNYDPMPPTPWGAEVLETLGLSASPEQVWLVRCLSQTLQFQCRRDK